MSAAVTYIFLATAWITFVSVNSLPNIVRIGAVFGPNDAEQEMAFRFAANRINADNEILPQSILSPIVEKADRDDNFRAARKGCGLFTHGIAAIFGPLSDVSSMHVTSVSKALDIPHIEVNSNYESKRSDMSLNLFPNPSVLSYAYLDVVRAWNWTSFAIVYEEDEGLVRLQDFFIFANMYNWEIKLFQFERGKPYRHVFWDVKSSGETNIILDVKQEFLYTALRHAQQVGMLTEVHSYLITSLDLHTIDLEPFKHGKTRITSFRLIDENSIQFHKIVEDWEFLSHHLGEKMPAPKSMKTETALAYDAVNLFALALEALEGSQSVTEIPPVSCEEGVPWLYGSSLINFMSNTEFEGLTGNVRFDPEGFRSEFFLDIVQLTEKALETIGRWNSSAEEGQRLKMQDFEPPSQCVKGQCIVGSLKNKTLVVTTIMTDPFTMLKEHHLELTGNRRFEGFTVDLVQKLSEILGFKYIIKLVGDKNHGAKNDQGVWNGMIGEVLYGEADIAVADVTITSSRASAVDFTTPFMNTGISILFKKPTTKATSLFSFLDPFSAEVYMYVLGAFIGVSVALFVVGRFSPYEWQNPYPCRQDDQVLENPFTLLSSFDFTMGALMQQGADIAPTAMSTRTIASIWYFFTLIMISSYTANLAAFLTVEKVVYPIENVEDLVKQTVIRYGCRGNGSTMTFFKESKIPTYARMWQYMKNAKPSVFVGSNKDGIARVKKGNYAYLMESAAIEYTTERNCDLTQIGGLLDSKSYGIAIRKKSPYQNLLSSGILRLQEDGTLHLLKKKWWKERRGGGQCSAGGGAKGVNELTLDNVGGVFVALGGGLLVAAVFAMFEFIWDIHKRACEDEEPFFKTLILEFGSAVMHRSSTKTVGKKSDESSSSSSSSEETGKENSKPGYKNI